MSGPRHHLTPRTRPQRTVLLERPVPPSATSGVLLEPRIVQRSGAEGPAHHWPHGSFQLQPRPPAAVSGRTPARLFVLLRVHSPRLGDRGRNRPGHVGTVTAQKPAGTQTAPTDIGRSDLAEGTHPDTLRCLATQNAGPGSHAGCFHKGGIAGNRLPTADPLVLRVCPPGNASKSETAV